LYFKFSIKSYAMSGVASLLFQKDEENNLGKNVTYIMFGQVT